MVARDTNILLPSTVIIWRLGLGPSNANPSKPEVEHHFKTNGGFDGVLKMREAIKSGPRGLGVMYPGIIDGSVHAGIAHCSGYASSIVVREQFGENDNQGMCGYFLSEMNDSQLIMIISRFRYFQSDSLPPLTVMLHKPFGNGPSSIGMLRAA